jgi:hypothetical protein
LSKHGGTELDNPSPPRFPPAAQSVGARLTPDVFAEPLPQRAGWRAGSIATVTPLAIEEPLALGLAGNPNPESWAEPSPARASVIALRARRAALLPLRPGSFAIATGSTPLDGRIAGYAPEEQPLDFDEVAELLARLLDRESDLRGLDT